MLKHLCDSGLVLPGLASDLPNFGWVEVRIHGDGVIEAGDQTDEVIMKWYDVWLVVWNIFYFPIYWVANHPNWLIFFRGVAQPPTRCYWCWNLLNRWMWLNVIVRVPVRKLCATGCFDTTFGFQLFSHWYHGLCAFQMVEREVSHADNQILCVSSCSKHASSIICKCTTDHLLCTPE